MKRNGRVHFALQSKIKGAGDSVMARNALSGLEYITRAEAELLMVNMLREYEAEAVEPRDRKNETRMEKLDIGIQEVKDLVNRGKGAMVLASGVITLVGLAWLIIQIIHAAKHGV